MSARFKLDENLPRDAEDLLRNSGHDVHTILGEQLGGSADPRVFDASQAEERILVTFDLDFSDIRVYPPASHAGIWVLRPHTQSIENTLALLRSAMLVLETEPTRGRLWIIEPERARIRE
jgi:predicted nuclease of predicted toxin-antitoxin system